MIKKTIVCVLFVFLFSLSFYQPYYWFFSLFCLAPIFYFLRQIDCPKKAFWFSYGCAFLFFFYTMYWFYHVAYFWVIAPLAFYSLFWGAAGYLSAVFKKRHPTSSFYSILHLSFIWLAADFLKGIFPIVGLNWCSFGNPLVSDLHLLQFANLLGGYGLNFVILFLNFSLAEIIFSLKVQKIRQAAGYFLCGAVFYACLFVYGLSELKAEIPSASPPMHIGIVQPNIPQAMKWDPTKMRAILEKTLFYTESLYRRESRPDLVIWPEASYPSFLNRELEQSPFQKKLRELDANIFVGAPEYQQKRGMFNSVFHLRAGEIVETYQKIKLVPFGEYVPFQPFFELIGLQQFADNMGVGNFSSGTDYQLFDVSPQGVRAAVLVCFEDTMVGLTRQFVKEGASLLVNMTNDAWFLISPEPFQHLQSSIVRAVENKRPLIRCANTGISAFISAKGELINEIRVEGRRIFIAGALMDKVIPVDEGEKTVFFRIGYLFPWFLSGYLIVLYSYIYFIKRK